MLSGLPDRPLIYPDLKELNHSDAIDFVFPVLPHSIHEEEDATLQVHDVLIATAESMNSVVYEEGDGWTIVEQIPRDAPKELAIDHVIEYRDYEVKDKEKALEVMSGLNEIMDEAFDTD